MIWRRGSSLLPPPWSAICSSPERIAPRRSQSRASKQQSEPRCRATRRKQRNPSSSSLIAFYLSFRSFLHPGEMIEERIYSTKGKIRRNQTEKPSQKGLLFNLRRKNVCDLRLRLHKWWIEEKTTLGVLLTRNVAELYSIKIKVKYLLR